MTFSEYQKQTAVTAIYGEVIDQMAPPSTGANKMLRLSYVGLGLGEVGETQGKIKKLIRDSGGVIAADKADAIRKELGDILWYVSQTASELGLDLDGVAEANIEKLFSRKDRGVLQGSGDER